MPIILKAGQRMALRGVKVLEFAGLAPAPFCGMILADFGADVIRIDKTESIIESTGLCRGKRSIAINLKTKEGANVVRRFCKQADVLIEPFRKGVMERIGIGPDVLLKDNPRLVYARLTGFGQDGPLSHRAGHDINFLAISGLLSRLARQGEKPYAPLNLLADFAGGSLICALGITMALYERTRSGKGQVIDANMVEGVSYLGTFVRSSQHTPLWNEESGTGWLDGGAPWYDTYKTKDGLFMSVGALEPHFYAELLEGLGLEAEEAPQFGDWKEIRDKFTRIFETKTQEEWTKIFKNRDACVMPVLSLTEAAHHEHNKSKDSFIFDPDGKVMPIPAPRMSQSPACVSLSQTLLPGEHTKQLLNEMGFSENEIKQLLDSGIVQQHEHKSKL